MPEPTVSSQDLVEEPRCLQHPAQVQLASDLKFDLIPLKTWFLRSAPTSPPSNSSTSLSSSPRGGHQSQRPLGQAKKFLSSDGKQACPLSSQTIPSRAQVLAESLQTAPSTHGSSPRPPRQLNQLRCPRPPLRCLPGSQSPTCAPPKVFEEAQLCLAASAYQRTAVWKKIWNQ